jgi:hypothetical protein
MAKFTCTEQIDQLPADYLLNGFSFDDFLETTSSEFKTKKDAKESFQKIKDYLTKMQKHNCVMDVSYCYINGRNDGRKFGKGMQGMSKHVRGLLTAGLTTDIDQVNCHPVILLHLCNVHNIDAIYLKIYNDQRWKRLADLMEDDNINREQAKRKFLIATNSKNKTFTKNDFLKQYDGEMKKIHKRFLDIEDFEYIKQFAKQDNFEGSFMNHVLCVYEDKILTTMIDYLTAMEYKIHSLMFDGLMIYGDHYDNNELLIELENQIEQATEISMKLDFKQHSQVLTIPDDYESPEETYKHTKADFELTNCKVGDKFVNVDSDSDMQIYALDGFRTLHMDMRLTKDPFDKENRFIDKWMADAHKRSYQKFDIYPNMEACPRHVYNMWIPFPVIEHQYSDGFDGEAQLQWFLNHLKVLVSHDQTSFDFFCMWLAQMFQYPEHKSLELVFISGEGAGKGLLMYFLRNIMGRKKVWEATNPQKEIFGNFNGMMKDAFLVNINEANKSNFYNFADQRKALITDPTININIKNTPEFEMKSIHRFIITTNNEDPVPKTERRTAFFRCSDEKIGNTEYFNTGFAYADDMDVCKKIYDYFMSYQTKVKLTKVDIPDTKCKEDIMEHNKTVIELWLEDYVGRHEGLQDVVTTDNLFNDYKSFCYRGNYNIGLNCQKFGMKLTGLGIEKKNFRQDGQVFAGRLINLFELQKKYKLV